MSTKKWVVVLCSAVFLFLTLYTAINVIVDPFGVFGDHIFNWYSYNQSVNPKAAKIAYLDRHFKEYDSYILGSSAASFINPEELNGYTDASFYNLFTYGSDPAS